MKIIKTSTLENPKYVQALKLEYEIKNKIKYWEIVKTHDSVAAILFNKDTNSLVIVKQIRPALAYASNGNFEYSYELCAGLDDKSIDLTTTIQEEILEEVGYKVAKQNIIKVTSYFTSIGFCGAKQTLYYCIVDNSMIVSNGGGIADENIEVIHVKVQNIQDFMFDEKIAKTPALILGFQFFLNNTKVFYG